MALLKKTILLLLIGCLSVSTTIHAQGTEAAADATAQDPAAGETEPAAAAITPEEQEEIARQAALAKEERKRAAKQKKMTMESCLTLVRAFYGAQDQEVSEFVDNHPTKDKQRLISKLLSKMMISCQSAIAQDQIDQLQEYKAEPLSFDYSQPDFFKLIELDWDELSYKPANGEELEEGEGEGPVEMSQEEILMSNDVEELSDEMKREITEEARTQMGKTQIAFFDLQAMNGTTQLVYLALILSVFYAIARVVYANLIVKKPDFHSERREKLREKRNSGGKRVKQQ